jgi:hypothetical protein
MNSRKGSGGPLGLSVFCNVLKGPRGVD